MKRNNKLTTSATGIWTEFPFGQGGSRWAKTGHICGMQRASWCHGSAHKLSCMEARGILWAYG